MFKNICKEFKDASSIEKFNFIASIITVSGVSLLTLITFMINFFKGKSIFGMAVFFLLTALLLIAATIIIGIAYVAIISLRKDLKGILFFVATPIVLLMALTLLLIAISAYIELLSVPVVG